MEQQSVRKTHKYKLKPTPEQEQELGRVLGLCRRLYNAALEHRIVAYQRRHVSVSRYQQEAELKDIRAAFPEYAAIHSHVLQDVLARLDKTYQAFFRRMRAGEKAGFPRYQGRDRYHSFTYKEVGNGAALDNGSLVLSKIGRITVRWSRPLAGTPKTVTISREAGGWYVCFFCADVPIQPLPPAGQETGIDLGIEAFATLSNGGRIFTPGWYRQAERALKTAQRRASRRKTGSNRRRKAVTLSGESASESEAPAAGLSSQGRAPTGTRERHDLLRRLADSQYGEESPSGEVEPRRGMGRLPHHPRVQGSMRR